MIEAEVDPVAEPVEMFGVWYWRHCVRCFGDGRHAHLWIPATDDELWDDSYTLTDPSAVLPPVDPAAWPDDFPESKAATFDYLWRLMAAKGECDDLPGAEYRRSRAAWIAAGCPQHIRRFVIEVQREDLRALRPPTSTRSTRSPEQRGGDHEA